MCSYKHCVRVMWLGSKVVSVPCGLSGGLLHYCFTFAGRGGALMWRNFHLFLKTHMMKSVDDDLGGTAGIEQIMY